MLYRRSDPGLTRTVALAAMSLAAMAVGACAGDEYRCTPTGCFFCDGVDCRPATPPVHVACRRDAECGANAFCTTAGCVSRCHRDTDCSPGWACRGASDAGASGSTGRCLAPTEPEPTPTPGGCTNSASCGSGFACVDGSCVATTMPSCTADAQCAGGTLCIGGVCTAAQDTCRFDTQCGTGRVCVNNQCLGRCDGSFTCGTGQECATAGSVRYCRPVTPGGPTCARDAECGAGRRCVDGACFTACTAGATPSGCASDQYCTDQGVCRTDTRPRPFCDDAHPCGAGSDCVGGVCRVPCSTSTDCQRVDITFRNCGTVPYLAMSTRTYCLTDNEARPNCTRQNDCSAGQVCADSICR